MIKINIHSGYRPVIAAIFIGNLFSLFYFLYLGFYNRPAWDDYAYMYHIKEHGFFGQIYYWYLNIQARFAPYFIINSFIIVYKFMNSLLPYTIMLMFLFVFALTKLLSNFIQASKFVLINLSFLILAMIIFSSFEFNTFFWLTASAMYYGGILFFTFGLVCILSQSRKIGNYLLLIISFIYVGCSAEHFGAIVILGLGVVLFYQLIWERFAFSKWLSNPTFQKLLLAFGAALISYIVMVIAPGNNVRFLNYMHPEFIEQIKIFIPSVKITMLYIFLKIPSYILIATVFFFIGSISDKNTRVSKKTLLKNILVVIIVLLSIVIVNSAIFIYAVSDIPTMRAMIFLSFFIQLTVAYISGLTGICFNSKVEWLQKWILIFPISMLVLLCFFVIYVFSIEAPLVKDYSQCDKKRISYLLDHDLKGNQDTLVVCKLPNIRYATFTDRFKLLLLNDINKANYSSETPLVFNEVDNVYGWKNNHIKFGLGLHFPFVVETNQKFTDSQIDSMVNRSTLLFKKINYTMYENNHNFIYIIDTLNSDSLYPYMALRIIYSKNDPLILYRTNNPLILLSTNNPLLLNYLYNLRLTERINVFDFKLDNYRTIVNGTKYKGKMVVLLGKPVFPIKYMSTGPYKMIGGKMRQPWELEFYSK